VIKAIATKQEIALPGGVDLSYGFGLMGTPRVAAIKLARWLTEIPPSERAEASVMYTVTAE